jgi:hypothetical protein
MFGFGVRRQGIANPGYGLAIYKHIRGTGNHRRGRETFVAGAQVSEKHNSFAHVASFASEFVLDEPSPVIEQSSLRR